MSVNKDNLKDENEKLKLFLKKKGFNVADLLNSESRDQNGSQKKGGIFSSKPDGEKDDSQTRGSQNQSVRQSQEDEVDIPIPKYPSGNVPEKSVNETKETIALKRGTRRFFAEKEYRFDVESEDSSYFVRLTLDYGKQTEEVKYYYEKDQGISLIELFYSWKDEVEKFEHVEDKIRFYENYPDMIEIEKMKKIDRSKVDKKSKFFPLGGKVKLNEFTEFNNSSHYFTNLFEIFCENRNEFFAKWFKDLTIDQFSFLIKKKHSVIQSNDASIANFHVATFKWIDRNDIMLEKVFDEVKDGQELGDLFFSLWKNYINKFPDKTKRRFYELAPSKWKDVRWGYNSEERFWNHSAFNYSEMFKIFANYFPLKFRKFFNGIKKRMYQYTFEVHSVGGMIKVNTRINAGFNEITGDVEMNQKKFFKQLQRWCTNLTKSEARSKYNYLENRIVEMLKTIKVHNVIPKFLESKSLTRGNEKEIGRILKIISLVFFRDADFTKFMKLYYLLNPFRNYLVKEKASLPYLKGSPFPEIPKGGIQRNRELVDKENTLINVLEKYFALSGQYKVANHPIEDSLDLINLFHTFVIIIQQKKLDRNYNYEKPIIAFIKKKIESEKYVTVLLNRSIECNQELRSRAKKVLNLSKSTFRKIRELEKKIRDLNIKKPMNVEYLIYDYEVKIYNKKLKLKNTTLQHVKICFFLIDFLKSFFTTVIRNRMKVLITTGSYGSSLPFFIYEKSSEEFLEVVHRWSTFLFHYQNKNFSITDEFFDNERLFFYEVDIDHHFINMDEKKKVKYVDLGEIDGSSIKSPPPLKNDVTKESLKLWIESQTKNERWRLRSNFPLYIKKLFKRCLVSYDSKKKSLFNIFEIKDKGDQSTRKKKKFFGKSQRDYELFLTYPKSTIFGGFSFKLEKVKKNSERGKLKELMKKYMNPSGSTKQLLTNNFYDRKVRLIEFLNEMYRNISKFRKEIRNGMKKVERWKKSKFEIKTLRVEFNQIKIIYEQFKKVFVSTKKHVNDMKQKVRSGEYVKASIKIEEDILQSIAQFSEYTEHIKLECDDCISKIEGQNVKETLNEFIKIKKSGSNLDELIKSKIRTTFKETNTYELKQITKIIQSRRENEIGLCIEFLFQRRYLKRIISYVKSMIGVFKQKFSGLTAVDFDYSWLSFYKGEYDVAQNALKKSMKMYQKCELSLMVNGFFNLYQKLFDHIIEKGVEIDVFLVKKSLFFIEKRDELVSGMKSGYVDVKSRELFIDSIDKVGRQFVLHFSVLPQKIKEILQTSNQFVKFQSNIYNSSKFPIEKSSVIINAPNQSILGVIRNKNEIKASIAAYDWLDVDLSREEKEQLRTKLHKKQVYGVKVRGVKKYLKLYNRDEMNYFRLGKNLNTFYELSKRHPKQFIRFKGFYYRKGEGNIQIIVYEEIGKRSQEEMLDYLILLSSDRSGRRNLKNNFYSYTIQKFDFLIKACEIMVVLEENELVHKDIKPSNFVVFYDEKSSDISNSSWLTVKLIDFETTQERHTEIISNEGTFFFRPPESAFGKKLSKQYDQFSFGVTISKVLFDEIKNVIYQDMLEKKTYAKYILNKIEKSIWDHNLIVMWSLEDYIDDLILTWKCKQEYEQSQKRDSSSELSKKKSVRYFSKIVENAEENKNDVKVIVQKIMNSLKFDWKFNEECMLKLELNFNQIFPINDYKVRRKVVTDINSEFWVYFKGVLVRFNNFIQLKKKIQNEIGINFWEQFEKLVKKCVEVPKIEKYSERSPLRFNSFKAILKSLVGLRKIVSRKLTSKMNN